MAVSDSYREYILEQLGQIIPVRARRMFGELGVYAGETFFALVADDRLYFKVNEATRSDYEAIGMQAFAPMGNPMSYYTVPEEVIEDADALREWMHKALAVARTSTKPKAKRRRVQSKGCVEHRQRLSE